MDNPAAEKNARPALQWFDLVCLNCGQRILSVRSTKYFGGWIPHEECGYETQFTASSQAGPCQQIATRPLARANHSQEPRTTLPTAVPQH
jgi:hypothetical protein